MPRLCRYLFAVMLLLLAGCGEPEGTPKERIRALIDDVAAGAEGGDIDPFKRALTEDFRGDGGRDRAGALKRIRLYLLAHQEPHLLVRVERIDVATEDAATARVLVGTAARPIDSPEVFSGYRASVHRVDLSLALVDGEWRVYRADWERTGAGELIRLW